MPPSEALTTVGKTARPSRVQESVLDEDDYTETLSRIIARDFFPQLPHLHATNAYLSALSSRDPELLSASIRRLAALASEEDRRNAAEVGESSNRRDEEAGTPHSSFHNRHRTPIGARYFDTPDVRYRSASPTGADEAGPSQRKTKKPRMQVPIRRAEDLSLNDFQRVFTSEDNASFADIIDEENHRKREKYSWAWEAEKKAVAARLRLEDRRERLLIEAKGHSHTSPTSIAGLISASGSGHASLRIQPSPASVSPDIGYSALVKAPSESQRTVVLRSEVFATDFSMDPEILPSSPLRETPLEPDAPLTKALKEAGLPLTALVDIEGAIVPAREAASGAGDARGRGDEERARRKLVEDSVMDRGGQKDLRPNDVGAGTQGWGYKVRNALMFPADADAPPNNELGSSFRLGPAESRQEAPRVVYKNTALDTEGTGVGRNSSVVSSGSPARSRIAAAVNGTPYRPSSASAALPTVGQYSLLPVDASPSPAELPDLLTWGTLMATPRALGGSGDALEGGRSFRLPETQRRDRLGRQLADDASRSMRMRAKGYAAPPATAPSRKKDPQSKQSRMLPPATPRRNASTLTPAARKLLERSSKTPSSSSRMNDPVKSSSTRNRGWTPSPAR